jgi:peptidoglycan-associated lipoprotein
MALFNSKDMDFCPVFAKKDFKVLYFSSNRAGSSGSETHAVTGAGFTDLWETNMDRKGKWSEATPLGPEINTSDDEGASALNLKGNNLYFTRCKVIKKRNIGCKLYFSTKKGTGWGESTEIIVTGVGDSISIGHPAISDDEMVLYFAANMPGGYGENDIWMLRREKKSGPFLPDPINMGPDINTPGNEVYPHVRPDNTLFFSSDYHVGMGGLDIFKATSNKQTGKYKVRNLRYPINSSADDFAIIFQGNEESGFFTSNRPGGKGGDDIYYFYLPALEFYIGGLVTDCKSESPLPGVKVMLKGSDGTTQEMLSEADGSYRFKLEPNVDYQIGTEKQGYLNGKGGESTKGIEENKDFKLDICMEPIEKPIELPNILYDLGKWDLRPESMVSLDKLIETLNQNPNIVIELGSHTDFRGDDKSNRELSQKRAESVVNYLIEKGIEPERLVAKGYGEDVPNTVNKANAERFPGFMKEGDVLTEAFIKKLSTVQEQEEAHQINRRTEFKVLRTDYVPKKPVNVPQNLPQNKEEQDPDDDGY